MNKKMTTLIGAASALACFGAAHAETVTRLNDAMKAESYDDLLRPVADPVPLLQASNAVLIEQADTDTAKVEAVQYYHHHHHHHRFFRRYYHHHHHHWFRHHHHHHYAPY